MEPEISRRCLKCGASVRGTAFFCPECGNTLKSGTTEAVSDTSAPEASSLKATDGKAQASAAVVEVAPSGDEPAKRQRVRTSAREVVEGKIGPRVEKWRQASNVMLEEASDDPNLRFVLIAIAIFVVALLFLWFNHLLG
ncbi:MAG: hypothetical protein QOJ64_2281 [Acidobacteriota bacterium]|jgi:hypothetical protein|nr:hypothetical protein [Acidobacteriota bacterium]